jgi:hypothetical protein
MMERIGMGAVLLAMGMCVGMGIFAAIRLDEAAIHDLIQMALILAFALAVIVFISLLLIWGLGRRNANGQGQAGRQLAQQQYPPVIVIGGNGGDYQRQWGPPPGQPPMLGAAGRSYKVIGEADQDDFTEGEFS